jgi:hypothetical protein
MKTPMKNLVILILVSIVTSCACAQTEHEWKVTLKVVDETGQPVAGAKASVGYFSHSTPASIDGLTDTNGLFRVSHSAYSGLLGFVAEKAGYYTTREPSYDLGFTYDPVKWNPAPTIILRKIGNPIPMYAKRDEMKFPKEDEPIGFDLMAGDWVAPFGKGKNTDMLFTVHRKIVSDREFDAVLTVTFPNKGDGITVAPSELVAGSEFKTSRTVAENGYEQELVLHYSNSKRPESVFGYFIRVRTIMDENGNVKSALYGKIRGDFRFYAGTKAPTAGMGFDYYLNPTPNDRNVEFDPKGNLMKNLRVLEGVSEP